MQLMHVIFSFCKQIGGFIDCKALILKKPTGMKWLAARLLLSLPKPPRTELPVTFRMPAFWLSHLMVRLIATAQNRSLCVCALPTMALYTVSLQALCPLLVLMQQASLMLSWGLYKLSMWQRKRCREAGRLWLWWGQCDDGENERCSKTGDRSAAIFDYSSLFGPQARAGFQRCFERTKVIRLHNSSSVGNILLLPKFPKAAWMPQECLRQPGHEDTHAHKSWVHQMGMKLVACSGDFSEGATRNSTADGRLCLPGKKGN